MKVVAGVVVPEPGDRAVVRHGDHGEFESVVTVRALLDGDRVVDVVNDFGASYRIGVHELKLVKTNTMHRSTDPVTSQVAALNQAGRLSDNQTKVLAALEAAGDLGMLDHDHRAVNGLGQTSAGKRRLELQRAGLVESSGRTRLSPDKSPATVWVITAQGRRHMELLRKRGAA